MSRSYQWLLVCLMTMLVGWLSDCLAGEAGMATDAESQRRSIVNEWSSWTATVSGKEAQSVILPPMRLLETIEQGARQRSPKEAEPEQGRIGGLVPVLLRSPTPWQWLNPLASAEFGYGERYLRTNIYTGAAEGIVFFSFRLPEIRSKSPVKTVAGSSASTQGR